MMIRFRFLRGLWALAAAFAPMLAPAQPAADCRRGASDACFFAFEPPAAGGRLHYYASEPPDAASPARPTAALIAMHGHSRDANKTFDAALRAADAAGALPATLVIAPLFQVDGAHDRKCRSAGVPAAGPDDLLWTCGSWLAGAPALNGAQPSSIAMLDALVAEVVRRWPGVRTITIAGFSAGAQMVQHAIGFAAPAPAGVRLRYVVADPGTWLYFDPVRPQWRRGGDGVDASSCGAGASFPGDCQVAFEPAASCADANRWKYGTEALPASLMRPAGEARAVYAAAEIHYLEGALDGDAARGTAFSVLDKSCAAEAQGPFRLQRGVAYAAYDRAWLARESPHPLTIVPGCAHDVACVFPSAAARAALFGAAN